MMLRLWGETLANLLGHRARSLPAMLLRVGLFAAELALIGLVAGSG